MPGIFLSQTLTFENVTEVAVAIGTKNLNSPTIGISLPANGSRNLIVESWPATARVELVLRAVQRGFAAATDVGARGKMLVVLTSEGVLGAFVFNHPSFIGS